MATKILIVDDDTFSRQILSKILRRDKQVARYKPEIIEALDGDAGLRAFKEHKPDLCIIDLLMPKLNGFKLCEAIRASEDGKDTALLVTSGVYKDEQISLTLKDDFQAHFFAKPYQLKHIAQFVAELLSKADPALADVEKEAGAHKRVAAKSGTFGKRSVPDVLLELLEQEATGRLILRRKQVVRQLQLFVGHPTSVTSNLREETLGHFLVSRGVIDQKTHREVMAEAAKAKLRLGKVLLTREILTPERLIDELTAQTRMKLGHSLRWADGSWSFQPSPPRSTRGNALDIMEVVVRGLGATTRVVPTAEIKALGGRTLNLNERGRRLLEHLRPLVSETFAEHFVDGTTADELLRAGVDKVGLYASLDILKVCDGLVVGSESSVPVAVVDELSEPIDIEALARRQRESATDSSLYASLFDSPGTNVGSSPLVMTAAASGAISPELSDELSLESSPSAKKKVPKPASPKGISVRFEAIVPDEKLIAIKRILLEEYLRVQDLSHFEVLKVRDNAGIPQIDAAYKALRAHLAKDRFSEVDLGRDYQKIDVLHEAYDEAHRVLTDKHLRTEYCRQIGEDGHDSVDTPSLAADIKFREAEDLVSTGDLDEAVPILQAAIRISPAEPTYHAALGWVLFLQQGCSAEASKQALGHIRAAFSIDPDSPPAHEYKGLIHAHLGDADDVAVSHLGKTLEMNPCSAAALAAMEKLLLKRDDHGQLKRLYRQILFQISGTNDRYEALVWSHLGNLHVEHTRDTGSAKVAYRMALKVSPDDHAIKEKLAALDGASRSPFLRRNANLRNRWRDARSIEALSELLELARTDNHHDGSYLAASALIAAGHSQAESTSIYQRYRSPFLRRAARSFDMEAWEQILPPEDYPLVAKLYSQIDSIIHKVSPVATEEVAKAQEIGESRLSDEFKSVRAYVAHMLGVLEPAVYLCKDFENQVHLATVDSQVLLAGPELLATTDKTEIGFRLARAMSYQRPGRGVAAQPARVLKSAMLACYLLGVREAKVSDPDGNLKIFRSAIADLPISLHEKVQNLVSQISQVHPTLNLSEWIKTLTQTANRVGLVIAGDLVQAVKCVEGESPQAMIDLIDFGLSPEFMSVRRHLGLSIDV